MADGADATDALHDIRHFVIGTAFAEFLEAAELRDVKVRTGNFAVIIDLQSDFGVAFDARDRVDGYGFAHGFLFRPRSA